MLGGVDTTAVSFAGGAGGAAACTGEGTSCGPGAGGTWGFAVFQAPELAIGAGLATGEGGLCGSTEVGLGASSWPGPNAEGGSKTIKIRYFHIAEVAEGFNIPQSLRHG